jgi:hypothetical protein
LAADKGYRKPFVAKRLSLPGAQDYFQIMANRFTNKKGPTQRYPWAVAQRSAIKASGALTFGE